MSVTKDERDERINSKDIAIVVLHETLNETLLIMLPTLFVELHSIGI